MNKMLTASRAAPFWKARERPRSDGAATKDQLLATVVDHLPPGPFTAFDFLNGAIGLNAIDNAGDADRYLQHLVQTRVLHREGSMYVRSPATD
jgi:hypothetical protein